MSEAEAMACQELVEVVTNYLEGAMASPHAAQFETHLRECGACVSYVEQMRTTIRLIGRLDADDVASVPPEVRAEILRAAGR